jgi:hypothetical protein
MGPHNTNKNECQFYNFYFEITSHFMDGYDKHTYFIFYINIY